MDVRDCYFLTPLQGTNLGQWWSSTNLFHIKQQEDIQSLFNFQLHHNFISSNNK